MAGLGELLELRHGARHRFRTVRAEVVESHHAERHRIAWERRMAGRPAGSVASFAAGPAVEPPPRWSAAATRLPWDRPDRLRLERENLVQVRVQDRWWSVSEAFGAAAGDVSSDVRMGIESPPFPPLFDPAVLLPDLDLEVTGRAGSPTGRCSRSAPGRAASGRTGPSRASPAAPTSTCWRSTSGSGWCSV